MSFLSPSGKGGARQQSGADPRAKLRELQSHPAATLAEANLQIPADMTDPEQIINYLLETQQITQNLFTKAFTFLRGPHR